MQIFNAGCSRDCLSDRRRNETLHHLLRRTRIAGIDYNRCAFHVGIFPHLQREERRTPGQENQEADNDREYRPPDEAIGKTHLTGLRPGSDALLLTQRRAECEAGPQSTPAVSRVGKEWVSK